GGRTSEMKAGWLPAPAHFAGSFLSLKFLSLGDKVAIARGLLAIRGERLIRKDLDRISMLDWLLEKRQPDAAIERFWRQVLVSAVNEELDRMAAAHGFQVFWLGFLSGRRAYEMGIPAVPLGELYAATARLPGVKVHFRAPVEGVEFDGERVVSIQAGGSARVADFYVSALPFERLQPMVPSLEVDFGAFQHSPITGIHLWFDRAVTKLPHGTLLDRTIQWFFNKDSGRYLMLVVSASRGLLEMPRQDVVDLALKELGEFLPSVRDAVLLKAHVVKEVRATYSAVPGLEAKRPGNRTRWRNFFLAGDWTRSGWPATMEGAVRSGYLAAEALAREAGRHRNFVTE
ncbi:MAG: hydroxysqualene dehydroxylase HpnE, partial [Bryobacteraceae bacterium]|nr:hydroxysqualene dehydroxylase HpnE [Bryobacteraceae bacterium]